MLIYSDKIEGFTNQVSYSKGETIQFKVNSRLDFSIAISRIESPTQVLLQVNNVHGKKQHLNNKLFLGVDWETTHTITVPETWDSGIYAAELNNGTSKSYAFFTIKGERTDIAVLASTNTWQAYNFWGNACFYDIYGAKVSSLISYDRPMISFVPDSISELAKENPFGKRHLMNLERLLLKWMDKKYAYDVIADPDLATDLDQYKTLVIGCHSEYWSEDMYNALDSFLQNKGKVIYLGGNAIYWKISQKDRFITCNKSEHETWRKLNRPESAVLGVQYTDSDYRSFGEYQLRADKHWIFNNTGLKKGDIFGMKASGWETDKTSHFTPDDTVLLAKGTNKEGGAEMVFRDGVFSAGSITFTTALDEPSISQLVKNVFDAFLSDNDRNKDLMI